MFIDGSMRVTYLTNIQIFKKKCSVDGIESELLVAADTFIIKFITCDLFNNVF